MGTLREILRAYRYTSSNHWEQFNELERLARIGEATEKAFKHNGIIETRFFYDGDLFLEDRFESIEELLEWLQESEEN